MGLSRMEELGVDWIEQMVEYISDNPEFIVRNFFSSGWNQHRGGFRKGY